MANTLAIWCPTYKRPHKLVSVMDNLRARTKNSHTLYFGVEPEDKASIQAVKRCIHRGKANGQDVKLVINPYEMGYSNTIQAMYEVSSEPFAVHINDDFIFHPNWDEQAIAMFETPHIMMVGVKQREIDTDCSAVCFWRRTYIETQSGVIDMPNRVFYPYKHNYQDTESTQTAQRRGVWAKCDFWGIDHKHPGFTGGEKDETYKKNDATADEDRETFESRKHLWQ